MDNNSQNQTTPTVNDTWIEIKDGVFFCPDCENESKPWAGTVSGPVEADLEKIKEDLATTPTKVILGLCPVCALEYRFRLASDKLYLEAFETEK